MPDGSFSRWLRGTGDMTSVQPLRVRIGAGLTGQQDARTHLSNLVLHSSLTRTKVWSAPQQMQTAALGWWLMQLYWEIANMFVESVAMDSEGDLVPKSVYEAGERLCRAAELMSVQAISNHSQAEVHLALQPMPEQPFPDLPIDLSTCAGVWAAYEAIYLQVQTDKNRILSAQVPKRFQPVLQQLIQAISPSAALHEYYQQRWLVAMGADVKLQIVRDAEDGARKLFAAGQKLWAPYLLGVVYQQCVSARQTIDDLELGFDPWAITDPEARAERHGDPKSVEELTTFWFNNPDPGRSYRMFREIEAAMAARAVRHVTGESFPYCPWAPLWVAWKQVELGGVQLEPLTYFTLYTGRNADGDFVSEIRRLGRLRLEVSTRK